MMYAIYPTDPASDHRILALGETRDEAWEALVEASNTAREELEDAGAEAVRITDRLARAAADDPTVPWDRDEGDLADLTGWSRYVLLGEGVAYRLERDGARDVEITGWLIGEGEIGDGGEYRSDWTRGTDVQIYVTEGEQYLVHVHQWTRWQGETGLHRVLGPVERYEALLDLLVEDSGGELGRASKAAWQDACETYPPLGHVETERIA